MTRPWFYALSVFALYGVVVAGVPLFPEFLGRSLSGHFTVGMALFSVLHTWPLLLAMRYLRARARDDAAEAGE